jgi:hypothetical protein
LSKPLLEVLAVDLWGTSSQHTALTAVCVPVWNGMQQKYLGALNVAPSMLGSFIMLGALVVMCRGIIAVVCAAVYGKVACFEFGKHVEVLLADT